MALNIDGTTGISGVDGSASAPALQGTDSNTGINFGSDTVNINTGGVARATVDSSGNVGLGTSSPSYPLDVETASGDAQIRLRTLGTGSGDDTTFRMQVAGTTQDNFIYFGDSADSNAGQIRYNHNGDFMAFTAGASERMRLRTSTGGLMIGEAGSTRIGEPKLHVLSGGSGNNVASFFFNTTDDRDVMILRHNGADGGNNRVMIGLANADGNKVGNIISNGSSTSYNTSSDYRLKENEVLISDGITRLKTLKPYRFNFKANPSTTVDGFFAHEVTAVPEAISGTKDETEDILYTEEDTIPSGKKVGDVKETVPKYQGIDQSKLVPLLTAALQEAVTKIETLETKVAALEAA